MTCNTYILICFLIVLPFLVLILIEVVTERFKGHSVSDPGLYRSKEEVQKFKEKDPITHMKNLLIEHNLLDEEIFKEMDKEQREIAIASMKFADESPDPDPITLENDVFAP